MSLVGKFVTLLVPACARAIRPKLLAITILLLPFHAVCAGESNQLCLASATGLNGSLCTANDVNTTQLAVVDTITSCSAGTSVVVGVAITIESSVDRFDIGLWINQAGLSAKSDAGSNCFRDALTPVADPPHSCNHFPDAPALPVYYDLDGDACGDVHNSNTNPCGNAALSPCSTGGGSCLLTRRLVQLEVACIDSDGNGTVDTGICTSWNNYDETACNGPLDALPDAASKCSCSEAVAIQGLYLEPDLEEIFLDGFETE